MIKDSFKCTQLNSEFGEKYFIIQYTKWDHFYKRHSTFLDLLNN
jgi:hypothetical protein